MPLYNYLVPHHSTLTPATKNIEGWPEISAIAEKTSAKALPVLSGVAVSYFKSVTDNVRDLGIVAVSNHVAGVRLPVTGIPVINVGDN